MTQTIETPADEVYIEPAHPQDLLVVGWLKEREDHPQFNERQVVSAAVVNITDWVRGRKFRRVYVTNGALEHRNAERFFDTMEDAIHRYGWRSLVHVSQHAETNAADDLEDLALAARLADEKPNGRITAELINALKYGD